MRMRVCTLDEIWEGEMRLVEVGSEEVLVVHTSTGVRAYAPRCPHQSVPLIEGSFEDGIITCHAHRWRFDAASGLGVNPKRCALTAYPVEVIDDDVYVELPPSDAARAAPVTERTDS